MTARRDVFWDDEEEDEAGVAGVIGVIGVLGVAPPTKKEEEAEEEETEENRKIISIDFLKSEVDDLKIELNATIASSRVEDIADPTPPPPPPPPLLFRVTSKTQSSFKREIIPCSAIKGIIKSDCCMEEVAMV
jgi:hypothetical protein